MFEDLGVNGVKALASLGDRTIELEEKTNDVKAAFEETFGAEVNGIMQEMKEPLIEIAEKGLIPILETASDLITEFAEWFSGLDEGTIQTIAKMGLITMAIAPVLSLISNGIGIVSGLTGGFSGLAGSSGILTTAMGILSGPVGIGLALAALGALLTYIGDNENAILWLQERFGGLGIVIGSVCEFISGVVQMTFGNMANMIGGVFDIIGAIIDGPGGLTVNEAFSTMMNKMTMTSEEAWGKIELRTTRGMSQMKYASDESLSQLLAGMEATMSQIPTITEGKYNEAAHIMGLQLMNMDSTQLLILQGMNDTTKNMFQGIREGMTISEAAGQVEKNLKQMAAAGRLDSDTLNKDISAAMKNLSEQLDVHTSKGSQLAIENTSVMSDEIIKSTDELNQQSSEDVQEMSDEIIKSANQMQQSATNSTRSMRDNVTNATTQMANQAIADWNRIRGAYSQSINGRVRLTTYSDSVSNHSSASAYDAQSPMLSRQSPINLSEYRITGGYYRADSVESSRLKQNSTSDKTLTDIKSLLSLLIHKLDSSSEREEAYALVENHVYIGERKFMKVMTQGVLKELDREQRGRLLSPVG